MFVGQTCERLRSTMSPALAFAAAQLALSLGGDVPSALAQEPANSAFVNKASALRDAAHSGVLHIVVTDHCDFTPLDMAGWWHHVKPASTVETIQGDCATAEPAVPRGTVPLRRLKPRQCVILHDANLLGFVALSPSHHWLHNLYFRLVRTNRAVDPIVLTLHDSAWAFLDALTFQGDGAGGIFLGLSVSATERVYLKDCEFVDLSCPGCPAAAEVAGIADFEYCVFDNIHMGAAQDAQGDRSNAAIYLNAYGAHSTHVDDAPPPTLRLEGNVFTDVEPYGVLTGHSAELESTVYADPAGAQAVGPNATIGSLGEARGIFLQDQHEWYTNEREIALAVKRFGGNNPGNGSTQSGEGQRDLTDNETDTGVKHTGAYQKDHQPSRTLVALYVVAAVVAVMGTMSLVWIIVIRLRQHRALVKAEDAPQAPSQKSTPEPAQLQPCMAPNSLIQMQLQSPAWHLVPTSAAQLSGTVGANNVNSVTTTTMPYYQGNLLPGSETNQSLYVDTGGTSLMESWQQNRAC